MEEDNGGFCVMLFAAFAELFKAQQRKSNAEKIPDRLLYLQTNTRTQSCRDIAATNMQKRSILFYTAITLFTVVVQGLEDEIYQSELDRLDEGHSEDGKLVNLNRYSHGLKRNRFTCQHSIVFG